MDAIIDFLNEIFWGYVLIYGLIGVGIYFTIRLRFLQFRHFGEFVRSVLRSPETDAGGITPNVVAVEPRIRGSSAEARRRRRPEVRS